MALTKRMRTITNCINNANTLADIGCDHGNVAVFAVLEGRAKKAIACDISAPSLKKAEELAEKKGLFNKITARVGDGLTVLEPKEADAIVIAGMGGLLIQEILQGKESVAKGANILVLSPNKNAKELRQFLAAGGYEILRDQIVLEKGKFYAVISATPGNVWEEEEDFYYEIGRKAIENKEEYLQEYLQYKLNEASRIKEQMQDGNAGEKNVCMVEEKIKKIKEVARWIR